MCTVQATAPVSEEEQLSLPLSTFGGISNVEIGVSRSRWRWGRHLELMASGHMDNSVRSRPLLLFRGRAASLPPPTKHGYVNVEIDVSLSEAGYLYVVHVSVGDLLRNHYNTLNNCWICLVLLEQTIWAWLSSVITSVCVWKRGSCHNTVTLNPVESIDKVSHERSVVIVIRGHSSVCRREAKQKSPPHHDDSSLFKSRLQ